MATTTTTQAIRSPRTRAAQRQQPTSPARHQSNFPPVNSTSRSRPSLQLATAASRPSLTPVPQLMPACQAKCPTRTLPTGITIPVMDDLQVITFA